MKLNLKSTVLAIAVLAAATVGIAWSAYGIFGQPQESEGANIDQSLVWSWPSPATDDTRVDGGYSRIRRDAEGIWYSFGSSDLNPGVHTVWIVVFNDPGACEDGCGVDDLKAGRGSSSAFWAPGGVIGSNGAGHFGGYVEAGILPSGPDQIMKDSTDGQGLIDPENAEVHLVLRSHGYASEDAEAIGVQLATFNGACMPNPDSCKNVQFSVHTPSEG